jgi:hypothetical protein
MQGFRASIHRTSTDRDGEGTLTLKIPSIYYDRFREVGAWTGEELLIVVYRQSEIPLDQAGPHE